jgi:hypothetical protein
LSEVPVAGATGVARSDPHAMHATKSETASHPFVTPAS